MGIEIGLDSYVGKCCKVLLRVEDVCRTLHCTALHCTVIYYTTIGIVERCCTAYIKQRETSKRERKGVWT